MDLKPQLLLFNKKEIVIIVILLVLVAMFSFTLGIRMGKRLGATHQAVVETAPFTPAKPAASPMEESPSTHETNAENKEDHAKDKKTSVNPALEKTADTEWASEVDKEKLKSQKPVPMQFPKGKKAQIEASDSKYTLQVGSYRTVAEATEQVTQLKHAGLEAFYLEADVPGKGTWYRVGIGIFPNKEQAEKTAQKWKSEKQLPEFLIQKIGD